MTIRSKKLVFWTVSSFLILGALLGIAYRRTLQGLYDYRFAAWEEERFIGKPVSELQQFLSTHGQELIVDTGSSYYALTRKELATNQRVMKFVKGTEYPWFPFGTANNVGFVVIQGDSGSGAIVQLIRSRAIDSL